MKNQAEEKIDEIKKEQNNYMPTMSYEEIMEKQAEYNRKLGRERLTLDEINQYIDEVRRNI